MTVSVKLASESGRPSSDTAGVAEPKFWPVMVRVFAPEFAAVDRITACGVFPTPSANAAGVAAATSAKNENNVDLRSRAFSMRVEISPFVCVLVCFIFEPRPFRAAVENTLTHFRGNLCEIARSLNRRLCARARGHCPRPHDRLVLRDCLLPDHSKS
jgi:hypothetical protein